VLPHYSAITDEKDDIIGSVAIVKDYSKTSDFAVTIRELNTLNYHLSSIFNNLSEVVFSMNVNKILSYANPAFKEMFGQESGDILQNEELNKIVSETIERSSCTVIEKELTVHNRHGQAVRIAASVLPLNDSQNTINGIVCIIQDMTSILRLEEKIDYSNNIVKFYEKQLKKIPKDMVCENLAFKEILSTALKVAKIDVIVILEGESGVGKDVMANFIHMNSNRADKPFIPVNCGAILENLWESEMFGYEEGSFTGAKKGGKLGLAELANKGTLFLDEIGALSASAQIKLLRFLENMEISKIGMKEIKKLDIRIIAASNRSLEEMVEKGEFRRDLYYRLNVIKLEIPPLRERKDEILVLANNFIESFNLKYNKKTALSPNAAGILLNYQWPGNIRQLKNVIEHSVVLSDGIILPEHFSQQMIRNEKENSCMSVHETATTLPEKIKEAEILAVQEALKQVGNNRTKAIKLLNISRKKFYKILKNYGLE
jgi:PAS domain S-box-containing protein